MKARERERILKLRDALSEQEVEAASRRIADKFLEMYGDKDRFLLYLNFRNEVSTAYIRETLFKAGKEIFLPVVEGGIFKTGRYTGEAELKSGAFGIKEPAGAEKVSFIDVIAVPGVAFDKNGNRIGFGRGYYDRFLSDNRYGQAAGLAYDFQVTEDITPDQHDVPLDVLITDTFIYRRNV